MTLTTWCPPSHLCVSRLWNRRADRCGMRSTRSVAARRASSRVPSTPSETSRRRPRLVMPDTRYLRLSRELFLTAFGDELGRIEPWVTDRLTSVLEEEDGGMGETLF